MNPNNIQLNRPRPIPIPLFSTSRQFKIRRFPFYRRRRIKRTTPSASISPSDFLSQFPPQTTVTVSSLGLIASFSGLALFLSRKFVNRRRRATKSLDIGEWILFTSPTPFNRFVILRCPTVSFQGGGSASLSDRLVQEDRHFVRLDTGRIAVGGGGEEDEEEETELEYQRVCVSTADGGVVSLDWPANLDLEEEHGLDTTLLLVPGTPLGSMDAGVRSFVSEALRRGIFPVVMNPRGCAGSPLTSARLFTAADSDDISTAIKYVSKARPWTTMMGVGWGYGANMLTKYLAEVGERTPLTAVTCINNPFDLEEATRCSPYHVALNQKLTGGLVDILQSNKELFQGRLKGFNVEKALAARSVRDFEKAISMVSYGFEELEDFYSNSSTRAMIGDVKIPVLFIQSDDGTVPLFSVPRSLIAENPYTSLLLCSYAPDSVAEGGRTAESWCQKFAIEWLTAVELGLLKGRHPLLKDVDVTINPSEGLALLNNRESDDSAKSKKLLDVTVANAYESPLDSPKELLENDDSTAIRVHSRSPQDYRKILELKEGSHAAENLVLQQTGSVDSHLVIEEQSNAADTERGQVLQTAQVVMNMLDATVPGILEEKQKEKILTAVSQGETLMRALQDAVPEDVRGKLTNSVTAILQSQQTNLKLDKLMGMDKISGVSAELKSKVQEKVGVSGTENMQNDADSSEQMKKADNLSDGFDSGQVGSNKASDTPTFSMQNDADSSDQMKKADNLSDGFDSGQVGSNKAFDGRELGSQPSADQQHFDDTSPAQKMNGQSHDPSDSNQRGTRDSVNNQENAEATKDREQFNNNGKNLGNGTGQAVLDGESSSSAESNRDYVAPTKEELNLDGPAQQDRRVTANTTDEAQSREGSIPDSQPNENEGSDGQKNENKPADPIVAQNTHATSDSRAPTFDVAQALDAFTGMDDSTQVAVNSVFGVIEDIISQMEQEDSEVSDDGKEDASIGSKSKNLSATSDHQRTEDITSQMEQEDCEDAKDGKEDAAIGSKSKNLCASSDHQTTEEESSERGSDYSSDSLQDPDIRKCKENNINGHSATSSGLLEQELAEDPVLLNGNGAAFSKHGVADNEEIYKNKMQDQPVSWKSLDDYTSKQDPDTTLQLSSDYRIGYLQNGHGRYPVSQIPCNESLDLDTTTALLLDYLPEEGQWKLLEESGNSNGSIDSDFIDSKVQVHSPVEVNDKDNCIEPPYVVLDSDEKQESLDDNTVGHSNGMRDSDNRLVESIHFMKAIVTKSLKIEVARKLSSTDFKQMESHLGGDIEQVANAVSFAIGQSKDAFFLQSEGHDDQSVSRKVRILHGDHVVRAIANSVQETRYLSKVLPVGVVIGTSLAALRKHFNATTDQRIGLTPAHEAEFLGDNNQEKFDINEIVLDSTKKNDKTDSSNVRTRKEKEADLRDGTTNDVMVGAVTAALGASALLMGHQNERQETVEKSLESMGSRGDYQKSADKLVETTCDKDQNNVVTSFAERALSVAAPVVPTKEDGEVDQDRLVSILADLGQKGGALRLVGKIALLWGGIRGAMSLNDRLILFLRLAERPLYQRILGFAGMVLVMWSPVVIPFVPTLVQRWTTGTPSGFSELVCISGLYTSILILLMIWGRRIRGYEDPLKQYGLELAKLPKGLLKGFVGGVMLVLSIQAVNALFGWSIFSWPSSLPPSSADVVTWLRAHGKLMMLVGRGIITATGVVLVEELLFRSWLPQEIAADLGYHRGIIISGLAFSLTQRSLWAVPGLWLLSLALAGFRQRCQGSLAIPIGLRAGMMASSLVLQTGGFLVYKSHLPVWVTGIHPLQPLSGVIGLAYSLVLAILVYPRKKLLQNEENCQKG